MNPAHNETLGKILSRTYYALRGDVIFRDGQPYAAEVFQTLLRYHGLTLVPTGGLVVQGDAHGSEPLDLVRIDADGLIHPPKLKKPYTADLAMRLGTALIAAATHAPVWVPSTSEERP